MAELNEIREFFVIDDNYNDQEEPIRILARSAADAAQQFASDADVEFPVNVARVVATDGQVMLFKCIRQVTHTVSEICEDHCKICDNDGYCEECGHQ